MIPEEAFTVLSETTDGIFISRGDDSGTHGKEKAIWAAAGYDYEQIRNAGDWYVEAGKGMGATLLMTSEMGGYTLTDMGTFLSYQGDIALVPIVDNGSILLNVYSAIAVNPNITSDANSEMAQALVEFLVSTDIQKLIGEYGVEEYGLQLFIPCAGDEPTS